MSDKCILVLSPPRSGSSCTTGCLHLSGVSLGKNFKDHTDKHNEKGYFENPLIYEYNRDVLLKMKHGIFSLEPVTEDKIKRAFKYKDRLKELIETEFADEPYFACKDPRILLLLPVWMEVLNDLEINVNILLLYRDIEHTIQSLIKFGFKGSRKKGERENDARKLVEHYHELMHKCYTQYDCYELEFERLIRSPGLTTQDVCKWIGIDWSAEKLLGILEFVDRMLVHHISPP